MPGVVDPSVRGVLVPDTRRRCPGSPRPCVHGQVQSAVAEVISARPALTPQTRAALGAKGRGRRWGWVFLLKRRLCRARGSEGSGAAPATARACVAFQGLAPPAGGGAQVGARLAQRTAGLGEPTWGPGGRRRGPRESGGRLGRVRAGAAPSLTGKTPAGAREGQAGVQPGLAVAGGPPRMRVAGDRRSAGG